MSIKNVSNLLASSQVRNVGSGLLWTWNGTDVSQFSDGAGNPSSGYSSPNGTIAADTITSPIGDAYSGNVIKYSYSGGDSDAAAWFVINDLPELPERYLVRAQIGPRDNGASRAGENTSPGIVLAYQDATHNVRVSRAASPTTTLTIWTANNSDGISNVRYVAGPTANLNDDGGTFVEVLCITTDPDTGLDPSMMLRLEADSGVPTRAWGLGTTWSALGSPPAMWDSSWQSGGRFKNLGVWFQELGASGTGYIADLKIYEV